MMKLISTFDSFLSSTEQIALHWQRGVSASHSLPIGTAPTSYWLWLPFAECPRRARDSRINVSQRAAFLRESIGSDTVCI
jgi:hypothetical protein